VTRRQSAGGLILNAVFLAFTLVLLVATTRWQTASRTVPLAVGIPLAILLAYRLIRDALAVRSARSASPEAATAVAVEHGEKPEAAVGKAGRPGVEVEVPGSMRDEVSAILWVLALPAAATVLGFVAGPALFVAAWARFRGGERIGVAIGSGLTAAIVVLLLFGVLLRVPLPTGLPGMLR
jgi:Tripartite tricarboxylate transporter TctB family